MFKRKLHIFASASLYIFFHFHAVATENVTGPDIPPINSENKKPPLPLIAEVKNIEIINNRYAINSGFGFIRAFKAGAKGTLGASGQADVKLSYLLDYLLFDRDVYAFGHYLPFSVSFKTEVDGGRQEYKGIISVYAVGTEMIYLRTKDVDYLGSFELGIYQSSLAELIPITESNPPIRRFGALAILGAEFRYKVAERFHIGPRIQVAVGGITFYNVLLSTSLFF